MARDSRAGRGPLSLFRSIYDLDTLDTRFTTPSSVPYSKAENDGNGGSGKKSDAISPSAADNAAQTPPARWKTPEFLLYYLVFLTAVPYMFWVAYDVSKRTLLLLLLAMRTLARRQRTGMERRGTDVLAWE